MGFFDLFRITDINSGLEQYKNTPKAVLLDVRTPQEYREGRVPGSRNIPLQEIRKVKDAVPDLSTPLFVYCLSGGRSSQAASALKQMGYQSVTNIGGIGQYRGKVEK